MVVPSAPCNHWRNQHSFDVVPFKQRSSQRKAWFFMETPVCRKETPADNRTSRSCQYLPPRRERCSADGCDPDQPATTDSGVCPSLNQRADKRTSENDRRYRNQE